MSILQAKNGVWTWEHVLEDQILASFLSFSEDAKNAETSVKNAEILNDARNKLKVLNQSDAKKFCKNVKGNGNLCLCIYIS